MLKHCKDEDGFMKYVFFSEELTVNFINKLQVLWVSIILDNFLK